LNKGRNYPESGTIILLGGTSKAQYTVNLNKNEAWPAEFTPASHKKGNPSLFSFLKSQIVKSLRSSRPQ
jgi:hypothetical protein